MINARQWLQSKLENLKLSMPKHALPEKKSSTKIIRGFVPDEVLSGELEEEKG